MTLLATEDQAMKSTGIVRPVDNLGRVVLPIELRHNLHIDKNASLEIYVDGDSIVLKKYQPNCYFCGSEASLVTFKDKTVCASCIAELKQNF